MRRGRTIGRDVVLIEFYRLGNAVRVVAIDQASGTEVTIVGPADASQDLLSRTAADKLRWVMRSKTPEAEPPGRSGIKV